MITGWRTVRKPILWAALALAGGLSGSGCQDGSARPPVAETHRPAPPEAVFVDRARELGLDFVHFNGMSGEFYFCENVGAGSALFDYDGDGDLDVYLVQGAMLGPGKTPEQALFPPRGPLALRDRLFRNELAETGRLLFTDVTEGAGIEASGYGMGVAAGDYDADGDVDLYVTHFGPNLLLRNEGDGKFLDVTRRAGVAVGLWSTSAAFADYDRDGLLDLFVVNYVNFSFGNHKPCYSPSSARDYCGPKNFEPYPSRLFRNRGDGTFEDVTAVSQVARQYGPGLGVVAADLDGDDWVDFYVANDGQANNLWLNQRDGTFEERGLISGCALSGKGQARAGMGVDAGDFDEDGDYDLFVTNMTNEMNTLYVNDGRGLFEDFTAAAGLAQPSLNSTGFGTGFFDYDNDGRLDLICANGAVNIITELAQAGDPYPLHQKNQLYHNEGQGRFAETSAEAGEVFALSEVSRGAAFGDLDNDGDTDVLITNSSGPPRLLINEIGNRKHWVGLRLVGHSGKTDALGADVRVSLDDGTSLRRRAGTDRSYLCSHDPRLLFGLDDREALRQVRVRWPDGTLEEWTDVEPDRYSTLTQGSGKKTVVEPT